ncbi:phosphatase PAP2 family protein [Paraburkholderia sp. D15]|uniref:phosphatase PAP2 family protein n=1 Tax=Paraburkholderia sp. D15 TaxID=2880218 RepID=UPI0024798CC5|nr:phosphatase PAP2 family protein [Paraburkholderia sp. D15]WGS52622.1 phosphatase PAP2 family protein [Paraburkholderia sp. D15]
MTGTKPDRGFDGLDRLDQALGRPDYRQALLTLLGMGLGLVLFVAAERIVTPRYHFATFADDAIPFLPWSWCVYVLFFPFVVVAAAYASAEDFRLFKAAASLAFVAALVCFALFTETVPRPDPALIHNLFLRQRIGRLWGLDLPTNGFPSLHVALTCLGCWMLWRSRFKWIAACVGTLICLSTLTIKQHTLVDVTGGALLSLMCGVVVTKWRGAPAVRGNA